MKKDIVFSRIPDRFIASMTKFMLVIKVTIENASRFFFSSRKNISNIEITPAVFESIIKVE